MTRRPVQADTIPGTTPAPPRPTLDDVRAATGRPVPPTPGQGCLVGHWHEHGLLDDDQRAALAGEAS